MDGISEMKISTLLNGHGLGTMAIFIRLAKPYNLPVSGNTLPGWFGVIHILMFLWRTFMEPIYGARRTWRMQGGHGEGTLRSLASSRLRG